jgi:hypothetical protein
MRALSSTLSSSHTTGQIHSDKRTIVNLVQPDSMIILITIERYVNRHVASQQKPRTEVDIDSPSGTITQVELLNWR